MKPKHIYIQPETDAALSKLGGTTRAENIRRAVALAEVAGELAEAVSELIDRIEDMHIADADGSTYSISQIFQMREARECLAKYKEVKQ